GSCSEPRFCSLSYDSPSLSAPRVVRFMPPPESVNSRSTSPSGVRASTKKRWCSIAAGSVYGSCGVAAGGASVPAASRGDVASSASHASDRIIEVQLRGGTQACRHAFAAASDRGHHDQGKSALTPTPLPLRRRGAFTARLRGFALLDFSGLWTARL